MMTQLDGGTPDYGQEQQGGFNNPNTTPAAGGVAVRGAEATLSFPVDEQTAVLVAEGGPPSPSEAC